MSKKHIHFIPSEFPTVTQYENSFVRSGREFLTNSMAEVMKYVAQATSRAIKDKVIQIDNNLSLAVK